MLQVMVQLLALLPILQRAVLYLGSPMEWPATTFQAKSPASIAASKTNQVGQVDIILIFIDFMFPGFRVLLYSLSSFSVHSNLFLSWTKNFRSQTFCLHFFYILYQLWLVWHVFFLNAGALFFAALSTKNRFCLFICKIFPFFVRLATHFFFMTAQS